MNKILNFFLAKSNFPSHPVSGNLISSGIKIFLKQTFVPGYYRVNYDEVSWRALSTALAKSYSDIPPASRASLIDDALSLARQGSLEYELAFELLEYFGPHERDYAPWRALARHVEQLDFALYETTVYPKFRVSF